MIDSALNQISVDTILLGIALIVSVCAPFITHLLDNLHNEKIYRRNHIMF